MHALFAKGCQVNLSLWKIYKNLVRPGNLLFTTRMIIINISLKLINTFPMVSI